MEDAVDAGPAIVEPPGRAVGYAFGKPALTALLAQPVLAVGLHAYWSGPQVLEITGPVLGIPVLLVLSVRLMRPLGRSRLRAETWWLAQAAARYVACCVTPLLVPLLVGMATTQACRIGAGCYELDTRGYAVFISALTFGVTCPALALLLLLAPHALRGRRVRTLFALITNAPSALLLLAGFGPAFLIICAQLIYAYALLPVAPRPARAR
ncbi:hypothetical protein F7Q99_22425 [Streptomyces kaniharaensis]|uniref:Uncharacterized protein n=1 Tax=Streptomyces kaniharaensis TaxID=212423 RepID=A0A6N7KU30_9ACTN|nr:hypothetical protein [Streptomyces kaniharaensis]MQS14941.1 hypothetical protein [Streptomyces kaniharaensis]